MRKNLFAALVLILLSACSVISVNAEEGWGNFEKVNFYDDNTFWDVDKNEWYSSAVQYVYEIGLMSGTGNNMFDPGDKMTVSEAVALASRLHDIYYDKNTVFEPNETWYVPYAQYAIENNITGGDYDYRRYNSFVTRSGFVEILANAFPKEELIEINKINNGDISDIALTYDFADDVYLLYRAGIISGINENGDFGTYDSIRRNEVAAIVARIIDPTRRIRIDFTPKAMHKIELGKFSHFGHISFVKFNDMECGYADEIIDDEGVFNHLG